MFAFNIIKVHGTTIKKILVLFIYSYITRLASNKIFSPSNKIHREVGRAKDLSAPLYVQLTMLINYEISYYII